MDCYENFIVCRNTCTGPNTVKPLSGLYVDDLAGISTSSLAKIEPGKYDSAAQLVQEKVRVAYEKVLDMAKEAVEPYVRENASVEAGEVGTFSETFLSGSAAARGLRIKLDGGLLMRLLIPRIFVRSNASIEAATIKVTDGSRVTTFEADLVAGETVEVPLHYLAYEAQVDITIEDEAFLPAGGTTADTTYFSECSTCSSTGKYEHLAGSGLLSGAETTVIQGIRAQVIVSCSIDKALCMMMRRLRWPVLYQFGVEVLSEWEATDRMNFLAIHGREWAEKTKPEWTFNVQRKLEIEAPHLSNFLKRLTPDCVTCGSGASYQNVHP